MPMPQPGEKESRNDFIGRFMKDAAMQKEFPAQDQCVAVAESEWRKKHGGEKEMSVLTTEERKALPDSAFAFPKTREYPIHNEVHARDALERVSQYGTPEEQAKVRAEVKRRYPSMEVSEPKKMSLVVDRADTGVFYMNVVNGESEPPESSDLFDVQGNPLPDSILGVPCTYCWKDLSSVGDWYNHARGFPFPVTDGRIEHWIETNNQMMSRGLRVPIVDDHKTNAAANNGKIIKMRRKGDRLQGLMQLIGPEAVRKAATNDVSVGADPLYQDPTKGGRAYRDAIVHVALTPFPANPGLNDAVLAASRAAAGASENDPPAAPQTHKEKPMAANLTDGQVGALRKHDHLAMTSVPDDGVGDHLTKFHDTHAGHLATLRESMPGGSDCPASETMSRAVQHVKTLGHVWGKLGPKNMSLAKPDEIRSAIDARIEMLAKSAEAIDAKDGQITQLTKQVQEMSRQIPANPYTTEDAENSAIENASGIFDRLMEGKNPWPANSVERLKRCLISRDGKRVNVACMSRQSNQGGSAALYKEIAEILAEVAEVGWAPKGPQARLQAMNRVSIGREGPDEEEMKRGEAALRRAMNVPAAK